MTGKDAPNSMESKMDKMLSLYLTLNDKIDQGNRAVLERTSNLRNAHNRLVQKVISQNSELVERDIRINNLASDLIEYYLRKC